MGETWNKKRDRSPNNLSHRALLAAIERGYFVDEGGRLHGPTGILSPSVQNGYPSFTGYIPGMGRKIHRIVYVHRLVAYQKYGEEMFAPGIEVRHLDGNRLNYAPDNIAIGTHRDNAQDIPLPRRKEIALKIVASRRANARVAA